MKLNIDLTGLWSNVDEMGAQRITIDLNDVWSAEEIDLDTELSTSGREIDLEEIDNTDFLLSFRGRQVLLFIPDQGRRIDDVLENPTTGRKFHISDCITLEEMRAKKRFERYKVTNNINGEFKVFGTSRLTNESSEGVVKLDVCTNCVKKLNYKGADVVTSTERKLIVQNFDLAEFFSKYSSIFKSMPKQHIRESKKGYTSDWDVISAAVRKKSGYTCQECKVCLKDHKYLLHTHHVNGVKTDNSKNNLEPLCADCHRKQDFHQNMYVKHADVILLNKLRRQQGYLVIDEWDDAFKLTDPACHGILEYCKKKGFTIPEIGYEVTNDMGEVIADVEIAWPHKSFAVAIGDVQEISGWKILGMGQALEYFAKFGKH